MLAALQLFKRNKNYYHWTRLEKTKNLIEYIKEFCPSHMKGINKSVYEIQPGNNSDLNKQVSGTYTCKKLILDLASWISPEFYIKCNQIILEYFGSIEKEKIAELEQKLKEKENVISQKDEALLCKERFIKNAKGLIENIKYKQK